VAHKIHKLAEFSVSCGIVPVSKFPWRFLKSNHQWMKDWWNCYT